jgi:hypothetical protein
MKEGDFSSSHLLSDATGFNMRRLYRSAECRSAIGLVLPSIRPVRNIPQRRNFISRRQCELGNRELGLIEGFLLCLRDSEAVRLQTSRWKRSLLVFSSGVCLEIAALPFLAAFFGYETTWPVWLVSWLFTPLGLIGLYASKFGDDGLVERLLVIPKLDLRL